MSARRLGYKILLDIEINKSYSNIAVNKFLKTSKLSDQDRGFVTELVYGVIENKIYLDYIINQVSKIKVKKMSNPVKIVLRMGVYQLLFLNGVKVYAAIDESVKMIKKIDNRSSGFVNAILRKISQEENLSRIDEDDVKSLSIKYSYEMWIVEKLVEEYGFEYTKKILRSFSKKPKIYIRINPIKNKNLPFDVYTEFIQKELKRLGVDSKKVEGFEEALELNNFKNIEKSKMFREGYISIQDISSMRVAKVMNPRKGSYILDLCAAPGGKTTHLGEILDNTGKIYSQDIHEHKVGLINSYQKRLGLTNIVATCFDATQFNKEYVDFFDYVLCDVPCSGMGIIRRKPEIKYKKKEEVENLPKIQMKILENASKYVSKGGVLIYSTCTIFREENEKVMEAFLSKNKNFVVEDKILTLPNENEGDGFFICKMKKI